MEVGDYAGKYVRKAVKPLNISRGACAKKKNRLKGYRIPDKRIKRSGQRPQISGAVGLIEKLLSS